MPNLYDPIDLCGLRLPNRVFMAPLTRNRAMPDGTPGPWAETYYRQRASAGLLITEATQISAMGKGYINTPGIYLPEHVAAWARIVDGVHAEGGHIFLQLWHVGRISHTSLLPGNQAPVAPSAIRAKARTVTEAGFVEVSDPRALTRDEIKQTIDDYGHAAASAKVAGFDGVEIHAANGYLIDQFLQSGTNRRTDDYGGDAQSRARFFTEVTEAITAEWRSSSVGVRLSPRGTFNDMGDDDPDTTFMIAVAEMSARNLGYLHVVESSPGDEAPDSEFRTLFDQMRRQWGGAYVANGGYGRANGEDAVAHGKADAVAYGRAFIANPDLPYRLEMGLPLNKPDVATFYGGTERGYIDYPAWNQAAKASGGAGW